MTDWKPIESAPRDGRKVSLCQTDGNGGYKSWPETFYYDEGEWYSAIDGCSLTTIHTHWMPLPPPPQEVEE